MKRRFNLVTGFLLTAALVLGSLTAAAAGDKKGPEKTFYRYINEQGAKVVGQTIPPQYIRNGYEVITLTGEVLRTVPPAPPEADAERINKDKKSAQEQARQDLQLRRSYSTTAEIDAAKTRNLNQLRNNINVLQANLLSVKAQLKDQEAHAANMERNGQTVSDDILKNIATLRSEEKDVTTQIGQREVEFKVASDKFDQDRKRFIEISNQPAKP